MQSRRRTDLQKMSARRAVTVGGGGMVEMTATTAHRSEQEQYTPKIRDMNRSEPQPN